MVKFETVGAVCGCCVQMIANADSSGCEFFCGDDHAVTVAAGIDRAGWLVLDGLADAPDACAVCGGDDPKNDAGEWNRVLRDVDPPALQPE